MEPMRPLAGAVPEDGMTPPELAALYGGALSVDTGTVYANFVTSLDGVAALGVPGVPSGSAISGRNQADRFLMGLLRARADAVLVGAGTLRDDHGHVWTPGHVYPPAAAAFASMRSRTGLRASPVLAVLTASGRIDPGERALGEMPSLVLTGRPGAAVLRGRLPDGCELVELPGEWPAAADALAALRSRGLATVLTEGGPRLMGELIRAGLVDELFLTLSPVLAGRDGGDRPGLVSGLELLPRAPRWASLVSARIAGDHLFLRYRLRPPAGGEAPADQSAPRSPATR